MKKIIALIFAAVMLCIGAVAAEAGYVIAPYTDSEIPYSAAFSTLITYTDEYATVISTGDLNEGHTGDLYFVIKEELDTSYEWIKMRIRNHSDAENFEFHFASSGTGGKVTAESCTHFPISAKDSEFKEYIFNIKQCNAATNGADSAWTGKATQLRFDCMWIAEPSGQMPKGSQMDIDYIAFFKSEEDAKAFAAPKKVLKEQVDYSDVVWDKNSPHFIFDNEEEISKWLLHDATASFELGNLKYVPQGTDPTLARNFDTPFSTKEYPYIAYRFKAIGQPTSGAIFFTSDKVTRFTSNFFHTFDMGKPGQWVNLVMDMNNIRVGTWEGNITSLRLDAINGPMDENSAVYINRIGFFKSEAEAYSFLSEGPGENFDIISYIESDSAKAIIPGGTLSEGYNENEYLLSGEAVDNAVVSYTDANGASSIVALGYTNEYGYTTYVANKAGKYTLSANHKDYTDIAGHWGENYINFVSDRALFGGTSPTEFSPDMTMTRGMFITVLGRMHGVDTAKYMTDTGYSDVPAAEYYSPYIKWAKDEGIMAGTSDTTFAPETPITRADMAVVINNYVANSGFTFNIYKELDGFTDLAGLDEATVAAINNVKNVGIVGGKGEGRFDPSGISTRAEVATVMERVIKAILGVNIPAGAYTNEYITRDRIRLGVWGFGSTLATPKGMQELRDMGIDYIASSLATVGDPSRSTILNYADVYGIEVNITGYYNLGASPTPEAASEFIRNVDPVKLSASFAHHPSFGGHTIVDEPGTDFFGAIGDVVDYYQSVMPGKRAFVNLLPMYANAAQLKYGAGAAAIEYYDADPELYRKHCQAWFDSTDADYICTDIYPLNWTGTQKTTYNQYIESINQIATVAREAGKEFWCCIQTYGWQANKRTPNEAEFRWQSYCMLSFGAKAILLWQYLSSNPDFPSLVDNSTYEPTQAYYDCKAVMWELRELSDVYVQYRNLGAFTHNATRPYQKMTGEYKDFDAIKSIESDNSLLIGCFEKKDGSGAVAFTIVNMEELEGEIPAEAKISVDPTKKITLYNRGKPIAVNNDGTLDLTFESGDGFFITVE